MSQNIKNTLYRFVTMRSPELIGDQEKANGFISYPEKDIAMTDTSTLPTDLDVSAPIAKRLSETMVNYVPKYKSVAQLKEDTDDFNEFAKWLIANRTRLNVAETDTKIADLDGYKPTAAQIIAIWDDLHHNIINNGSPYLRDLLLSYIVAEFFVTRSVRLEKTDEAYRKMAQSRVVIDKSLFSETPVVKDPETDQPIMAKDFQKEMDLAIATEQNEELRCILEEIERAEKVYIKENQKAQDLYQKDYDGLVKKAYDDAAVIERIVEDSETGTTAVVRDYDNLILPAYDFSAVNELEDPKALGLLSEKTLSYVNKLSAEFLFDSFSEIKEAINTEIKTNVGIISENTDLGNKQINVLGTPLPVKDSLEGTQFSFSCCALGLIGSETYSIIMTIKVPDSSYDVTGTLYHMNYTDGTSNTNGYFRQRKLNNSISLTLYNGITINKDIERFKGDITFANGAKYKFNIPGFSTNGCSAGTLTLVSGGNPGSSDDEVPTGFGIQRLGIADYRKVEQEVCCYVPGEVSHIENIMAREYKEKSTRRLRRQEDTLTTSAEQETESLTETTSTGRFEMNQEIASVIAKDQSFAANAGVSYSNPSGFSASANASYANNTSKEESNLQAISQAKELTERALDRVVQKVREERVTKVVEEYEENSSHGFDNRKGDKHISGVYRWVDKIYNNSILNYGKRLMYEFMIPEPAAFHDEAIKLKGNNTDEVLTKPVDPRTSSVLNLSDYSKVTASTLKYWAGVFNASIDPLPAENVTVSKAYSKDDTSINNGRFGHAGHENVDIPEGYLVSRYSGYFTYERGIHEGTWRRNGSITIGGRKHSFTAQDASESIILSGSFFSQKISNSLEFSVTSWDVGVYAFNLYVTCELSPEGRQAQQIKAFEAIMDAYETKLAEYNEKLEALKAQQEEMLKVNPGFYRQIEKTVLRKNCITYLLGQDKVGVEGMITGEGLEIRPNHTNDTLDTYAARVKFFEQAFEWDIMSYQFYPFYWAKKENWGGKYIVDNNDPLFKAFLQSGMARVIITVRPGFEEMVNWYLATGQIWNGGQVPTIDDEEFVSIVEELQNPESVVEETWETRVPTSLTVIQAGSIGLNVEGLPCDSDCADWSQFDSDLNPIQQTNELIGGDDESIDTGGIGSDTVGDTAVS
ncbi:hypothetical protein [uncultured Aquimarina sp.]|uniref:hypothetical protein n=1 Tax=uncultured Aquimarina sp. TaxID=575652 RepID=UPI00261C8B93|nr:hypothetical protein [uncultured Aquimarina sp.]